jgi:hypothetical protein
MTPNVYDIKNLFKRINHESDNSSDWFRANPAHVDSMLRPVNTDLSLLGAINHY